MTEDAGRRAGHRSLAFALIGTILLLAPALLLLVPPAQPSPVHYPFGDQAAIELGTRLAMDGSQRVGPYSRYYFHHPGPAFAYLSIPLYAAVGQDSLGLRLTALLLNALAILTILYWTKRSGGWAPLAAAIAVLALDLHQSGPTGVWSSWNPRVAVLPFGASLVAAASVACGRTLALPLAVAWGSLAVQCHVSVALPLAAFLSTALTLAFVPALRRRLGLPALSPHRSALIATAVVIAVFWALPLAEQIDPAGGNLTRIMRMAGGPSGRTVAEAWTILAREAVGVLTVIPTLGELQGFEVGIAGLVLAVLVAATAPRGGAYAAGLAIPGAAAVLAGAVAIWRIPGRPHAYLLMWTPMLALVAVAAGATALAERLRDMGRARRLVIPVAGAVAIAIVAFGVGSDSVETFRLRQAPQAPPPDQSEMIRQLVEPALPALRAPRRGRIRVFVERPVPREVSLGLILALDKAGIRLSVEPFGPFRFEGRLAPDGNEEAMLYVGPEDAERCEREAGRLLSGAHETYVYLLPREPGSATLPSDCRSD